MCSLTSLQLTQPMPVEMVWSTTAQPAMTLAPFEAGLSQLSMLVSEKSYRWVHGLLTCCPNLDLFNICVP